MSWWYGARDKHIKILFVRLCVQKLKWRMVLPERVELFAAQQLDILGSANGFGRSSCGQHWSGNDPNAARIRENIARSGEHRASRGGGTVMI